MKNNYIELINKELPKLSEDNLYKVLVLVKNTVDVAGGFLNRALCDNIENSKQAPSQYETDGKDQIVKILEFNGLTGGHGIFCLYGCLRTSPNKSPCYYVCFCIHNEVDCMITIVRSISPSYSSTEFVLILETRSVSDKNKHRSEHFSITSLEQEIQKLKPKNTDK